MNEESRSTNQSDRTEAPTDSGNIRERVEKLREQVSQLDETLEQVKETARQAAE